MTSVSDSSAGWQFWVDRGGTFTDLIARHPDGHLLAEKLLSEQPAHYADAAAEGIRRLLKRDGGNAPVSAIRIATTVATNALLEQRGPRTLLILTEGFADLLAIGDQRRPQLFALQIHKRALPDLDIITTAARMRADGSELAPLDDDALRERLRAARADGIEHVAISLLHGWRNAAHEQAIAALAEQTGFASVLCSHQVSPLQGYLARTETTLVDSWLTPVIQRYLGTLRRELADIAPTAPIDFMQSNGGLIDATEVRGKDSVLSGPAGGVIGLARCASAAGLKRVIGFDMGGTSTDICLWQGEQALRRDNEIGGYRLRTPMLRLDTIAAGGGSLLRYRDQRLQVGPASAGADPGPAAYGCGGPLALTDANLLLGRLPAAHLPAVFGPDGNAPLDPAASRTAMQALIDTAPDLSGYSVESLAEAFITVAVDNMASAIRRQALQRGEDVRTFVLAAFGGAAGQLACRIAESLGIESIWLHPLSGVFSALGVGLADRQSASEQPINRPLSDGVADAARLALAHRESLAAGWHSEATLTLRLPGNDATISLPLGGADAVRRQFSSAYRQRYGIAPDGEPEVVALRLTQVQRSDISAAALPVAAPATGSSGQSRLYCDGEAVSAEVAPLATLAGQTRDGPLIITAPQATVVVETGWQVAVGGDYALTLTRREPRSDANTPDDDAVLLEVFNNRFAQVAQQMGYVLEHTAQSVNIRERLDFSCALFDADGQLIANAPHMPVHLGSMGASVQHVRDHCDGLRHGDVVLLNSPYAGGTHLPDITAISPWHDEQGVRRYWLATRAHHADVGGITPGSMPAASRHIDDEGVLLDNLVVVSAGQFDEDALRLALADHPHPARTPARNLADIRAQIAAQTEGARQIVRMREQFGGALVDRYMQRVRDNAAQCVRGALRHMQDGDFTLKLDNGLEIRLAIRVDQERGSAVIDFSGSSAQHAGNFNAPFAVTRAATLYVLRTLVEHDIPLNDGCLEPVSLIVPEGSFLNPGYPAAVVAGNVETSQCVTNALYGALGVMASAQSTMNNLTFGNAEVQYYETIAGGTGAGDGFDGADGVQSQMTNSRMTDAEVLEDRLPVLIRRYALRRGSGGGGHWRGGDGVVRELEFLTALEVSIISGFRDRRPFALHGGEPGMAGRNRLLGVAGDERALAGVAVCAVDAGDRLVIETPGGGGFGRQPSS